MPPPFFSPLFPLFFLTLAGTLASPELVLEPGYSVSTVLDFNKPIPSGVHGVISIRPFSILPLSRSPNIVLLDSTHSSFYSLDLPISQGSVIRLLSGKGTAGFSDGDPASAMFDRPRSFAVDSNDNVYVADRINHVIRKISSSSGLTSTIAGGYPRKAGHTDGPAQNATFSEDFDLLYMPKMCALLISDRGSGMIRQMNLRLEDCEAKPQPSKGLGAISVSLVAVVALLCGLAFGFIARPFVVSSSSAGSLHEPLAESLPINLEETAPDVLLRHQKHYTGSHKMHHSSDGRKDLIDFEEESCSPDLSSADERVETEDASAARNVQEEVEVDVNGKIDRMMISNLFDFALRSKHRHAVKRRNGVQGLSY